MDNKSFYISNLEVSDATQLHKFMMANVKRFIPYLPYTLAKNLKVEGSEEYILAQQQKQEHKHEYTFTLKDVTTNVIFALIILKDIDWQKSTGEFAYCIDEQKENKGIMSSAITKFSQYAFTSLHLKTLHIISHKTNIASIKVATNAGFIWTKTLKNEYAPPNAPTQDMELYELQHEG
ncbi:GNAT family N-acetyltransferase [Formosa sp. PL04]|uniref:GNAT family N-acetyltransferase n=1 Tax=Formosa sp. PL04 TaxID=3081755 RepID=UPI002981C0F0|nr:GNAT family N-acetyltransferase [Formosa sp. PL04]MDW5289503.1 GNAT family N-acetyltransferase [Formosa sp. PL04]